MSILSALVLSRSPMVAFVILGMFWGCFAAFVPVLKAQLGANDAVFGILLLGSAFGLVSAMWLAPRIDRLLAGRGMQAAAASFALVFLLPGVVTAPWLFVLVMVGIGASSGLLDVVMNSRVSELEAQHGRSLMNANHAMFSVAYGLSAILTGAAREAGLPPVAVFGGFAALTALLLPLLHAPVQRVDMPEGPQGRYPLLPILLCGGVVLVAFMSEAAVEAWSALHIERTLSGGAAEGALGPAMLGLTMAVGRFSGQVVAERLREVTVIFWASLLSAAGALTAAFAPSPLVAYVGFGTLGLGVSVIGPMGLALVGKLVPPHLRTEAIARAAVIGFSGFFVAPVAMGLVSQAFGLRVGFAGVAVLLLCAIPLALTLARLRDEARAAGIAVRHGRP